MSPGPVGAGAAERESTAVDPDGPPLSTTELERLEADIDRWLVAHADDNPAVLAVERGEPSERRWYVRLAGEEKDVFTVWLTLGQRTLRHEIYVLPAPHENEAAFYRHLLVRNAGFHGWRFEIGDEDAVYLVGQIDARAVDEPALDRILGSGWVYVERCFRGALRLGFAAQLGR